MKAIETKYKGYRFRSRLEARWAVFLDSLEIDYTYELEGFDLGGAGWYLPDFYLTKWDMWLEVKPVWPTDQELHKFFELCQQYNAGRNRTKKHSMVCGSPWLPKIRMSPDGYDIVEGYVALSTAGAYVNDLPLIEMDCFAATNGGKSLDIWPLYLDCDEGFFVPPIISPNNKIGPGPAYSLSLYHGLIGRAYLGAGVFYDAKPIEKAYRSARSASF